MGKQIDVYVKLPSGRTSSFFLDESDLVKKVYQRIADEEKISVDLVQIKYTGKCINPSHTVGYVGICAETILKAEVSVEAVDVKGLLFGRFKLLLFSTFFAILIARLYCLAHLRFIPEATKNTGCV
jgi:Ubiquitin family